MRRWIEILLGLKRGFLGGTGEFSLQFNPQWPGQSVVGASIWNLLLLFLAALVVVWVYRREARALRVKIILGIVRSFLLLLVIALLNRPVLTLTESRTEPSVLAVMVDDSISMRVRDIAPTNGTVPASRLDTVIALLSDKDRGLIQSLAKQHQVRLYRFDRDAQPIDSPADLQPRGESTQVSQSVLSVLNDLQGQRLAGVVLLTDGRETPARSNGEALRAIRNFGVKIYPVATGSDRAPRNIEIQSISVQDAAFKGDIVNLKLVVRASGFEVNHPVKISLKNKKTSVLLVGIDGKTAGTVVSLPDDQPLTVEVPFKATEVQMLDIEATADKEPGESDEEDNSRSAQLTVLDAKINLLYVDGYPRWEYRYLKNEMIRDKSIAVSCLLTSADPNFAQEGDRPITRFPETLDELMDYDVVIFGDVDPKQFTDNQLQLLSDFVAKKGGGFGMIAGPRWSPAAYRNSAIEALLPVSISRTSADENININAGFRPSITRVGADSSIFRFFINREQNEKFLKEDIQPIFWFCKGISTKPGVGEAYAEHPTETGPDGRKAPILVLGRFGAGRTLFSAIDDSWRWRFYTGESIFDTYWVQQVRYLARSKKLGQRKILFTSLRPSYELGEQVRLLLRVLDPALIGQLPEQLRVELHDPADQVVRVENLVRQEGQKDTYALIFTADGIGKFSAVVPPIAGGVDMMSLPVEISLPRLELSNPAVDRAALSRLASETLGKTVELADAGKLPTMIQSAARVIPIFSSQPLWDAPLAMALFVLLITVEWIIRKMNGMV